MEALTFTLELRGEAVELERDRFWAESRAAGRLFVADTGGCLPLRSVEGFGMPDAVCRRRLELAGNGSFAEAGEISFGPDDALIFSARGTVGSTAGGGLRHGVAVRAVTGGRGRFSGASGSIASFFLLARDGTLTDYQLGLLLPEPITYSSPKEV